MKRYDFFCFLSRVFLRGCFRIEVYGLENIPPTGPFIIAPNHVSFIDPLAAGAFSGRDVYYMARDSLFKIPLLGKLITWCNAFPVKRNNPGAAPMRRALSVLRRGEGLLVFPEGRRSLDGNINPGSSGVGLLAVLTQAPVVPVFIAGTEKALPPEAVCLRFAKVKVFYLDPVFPPKGSSREDYARVAGEVMDRLMQKRREIGLR